ncbi:MAG: alpha/beta hydrolase [Pseudomonadota bacterium]
MTDADDAYANAPYIAGGADYPARWTAAAAAFRAATAGDVVAYGPSPRQHYEWYVPGAPKGTVIFVHGGYWRQTDPSVWSHLAAPIVAQGWACALPGYDLCPAVPIASITQQIAHAIQTIAARAPGALILAGHSAGGHLAARMCAPGMLPAAVMDRVRRVVPISPLTDLAPLRATLMNDDFRLDQGMARVESPVHQPAPDVPVSIWVGAAERPVFLEHAGWLKTAWGCACRVLEGENHYTIVERLGEVVQDDQSPSAATHHR